MDSDDQLIRPVDLDARRSDGWMLLDVRTDAEWAEGRIDGSTHIPMDQVVGRLGEVGHRVVCICAVGARSGRVADYLNQQGYEAVNLVGGIQAWQAEGRSLVG